MSEEIRGTELAVVGTAQGLAENSAALKIKNAGDCGLACEFLKRIKMASNKVEDVLGPIKKRAFETYKEAIKLYSAANDDIEIADRRVRDKITEYLMSVKEIPELPEGVSVKSPYQVDSVDIKVLCQAVLDGKAPANLISVNKVEMNKLASAMKDYFNVPGITVKAVRSVAIRIKEEKGE